MNGTNIYYILMIAFYFVSGCKAISENNKLSFHTPEPFEKSELKILSWNVEHMVDMYDNPYIHNIREDSGINDVSRYQLIAEVVKTHDPDIVVLQEFESEQLAKWLVDSLLPESGYAFFTDIESIDWYMNVVIMSRIPLGMNFGYGNLYTPYLEDGETKYQRHLNTRILTTEVWTSPDTYFYLTGVHLKAGGGDRNQSMRLEQLQLINERLNVLPKLNGFQGHLLMGDLNSYTKSDELQLLLNNGFSVAGEMEINTHPADSAYRRLDYILMDNIMSKFYVDGSAKIGGIYPPKKQDLASDHLPLLAMFDLK